MRTRRTEAYYGGDHSLSKVKSAEVAVRIYTNMRELDVSRWAVYQFIAPGSHRWDDKELDAFEKASGI